MEENKNNKNILLLAVIFIVFAFIGAGAYYLLNNQIDEAETDQGTDETRKIVEVAQNNASLSTLVDALVAAELDQALDADVDNYTVFAPNNQAFSNIQSTVDSLLQPENQAQLEDVLTYHVLDKEVLSTDLQDGQTVETLNGEEVKVRIIKGEVYINNAQVLTADVEASNGVVHIIDTVLQPGNFGDVVATAQATESLSTLVTALQAADLVETLVDQNAEYTVFAPTNAAFADIQETVDTLLQEENKADLQRVLTYHVVDSEVFSSELKDGQAVETLNGHNLTVEIENGSVYLQANDSRAMVTQADIKTSNGAVHVIDTVLLP